MPCIQSISDAKACFASKVSNGIATLMDCGYSRERATNTLLRELNRGESSSSSASSNTTSSRPTDEEIFDAMKNYNLGIEEATKAIIVSRAMRRAMVTASSPAQAIEILSAKLSVANLLYDSSSDDDGDDDLSIRPELRVEPVVPVDRQHSSRKKITTTSSSRKTRAATNKTGTSSRPRSSNKGVLIASRKRSIEETGQPVVERKETRERSDSVTEVVNAKVINAKKSTEDTCGAESSSLLRTPSVVRGKRVLRVDDSDGQQTSCHKRIRSNES